MRVIIDVSECGHYPRRDVVVIIETKKYKKIITVTNEAVMVDIEGEHSASTTITYRDMMKMEG